MVYKSLMRCVLICVVIGLEWQSVMGQALVPDIQLKTIDNKPFSTKALRDRRATVMIFMNPECPITQAYMPLLAELHAHYLSSGVDFYGVLPPSTYQENDLQQFQQLYKIPFSLVLDSKRGKCTHWLQATITPEVLLVDSTGSILYRGAIDNQFYALGKRRTEVTEHYLKDALEAKLHNSDISVKQTKPVGCLIEVNHR